MICHTTTPSLAVAEELANHLVGESLGACVSIQGPLTSIYRWKGTVERSEEYVLTIKTTKDCMSEVERTITDHHPYDVPELLWLPASCTGNTYEQWIENSVKK